MSDAFALLSEMLDVYAMPNVEFTVSDYNVPEIDVEVVWGNTGEGGGGVGVDVA